MKRCVTECYCFLKSARQNFFWKTSGEICKVLKMFNCEKWEEKLLSEIDAEIESRFFPRSEKREFPRKIDAELKSLILFMFFENRFLFFLQNEKREIPRKDWRRIKEPFFVPVFSKKPCFSGIEHFRESIIIGRMSDRLFDVANWGNYGREEEWTARLGGCGCGGNLWRIAIVKFQSATGLCK